MSKMAYNAFADNASIVVRFAVVASQICEIREILRKFELIAVQGHPRSSILVPMESAYNFLLVFY